MLMYRIGDDMTATANDQILTLKLLKGILQLVQFIVVL